MLRDVAPIIRKITKNKDLTVAEAEEAFDALMQEDEESYYFFALTAALHTKGETTEELYGFCKSVQKITPSVEVGNIDSTNTIDVSGTGGDPIKTFNVSTTATFAVAAGGVAVPKQAFFAVTGYSGSADLLGSFGINVPEISGEPTRASELLEKTNISTYHFLLDPEGGKGMVNWVEKRKEIGLNFVTPLHFVAFAYSPFPMESRIYGVSDEKYLRPLAELFQKLGYKKGLVFYGVDGIDEISNIGPTKVCEFHGNNIEERTLTPENDLGIEKANPEDIQATSEKGNIRDFLKILYGEEKGPKRDLVLANSSAAFYAVDKVDDLKEGVELAASIIDEGKASNKLEEYVRECGDYNKLKQLKSKYLD